MLQLSDLDFFATVAQSPSLAAAARALNVSSSAVTQRLQDLERRVGAQLIDRSSRGVILTDEGETLALRGTSIRDAVADLEAAVPLGIPLDPFFAAVRTANQQLAQARVCGRVPSLQVTWVADLTKDFVSISRSVSWHFRLSKAQAGPEEDSDLPCRGWRS